MSIKDRNLKPGTVLVARYKKQEHRAEVVAGENGQVRYKLPDGREFTSPSAAGSAVMGGTACNGWRFWSVEGAEEPTKAKSEPKAKTKGKPKANAEPQVKAEAPVSCGDCGKEFPSSRGREAHAGGAQLTGSARQRRSLARKPHPGRRRTPRGPVVVVPPPASRGRRC